jgi:glycosyltransferase involved in cell wall biosynthesis
VVTLPRPWYWLVVGSVVPEYEKEVRAALGDQLDRVWFSHATVDNIHEFFQAADLYIHGSLREGNCNAVNEALMSGVPIVVKENGSYGHLAHLTPSIGRIVDTDDPDAFSRAIEEVGQDRPDRSVLAQRVLPLLGSAELETTYLRLFRELAQIGD